MDGPDVCHSRGRVIGRANLSSPSEIGHPAARSIDPIPTQVDSTAHGSPADSFCLSGSLIYVRLSGSSDSFGRGRLTSGLT